MNIKAGEQWRLAAPLPAGGAALQPRLGSDPLLDALAFLIPIFVFQEFRGVGRLFLPELLLLALLPWLLTRETLNRVPRSVVVLGIMWLFGQVLTDAVHGSAFADYSRGWSKIAFTLTNFCALYLLLNGNPRRLLLFGFGLAAGLVLQYYLDPGIYAAGDPWKFGLGWPITFLGVLLVAWGPVSRLRPVPPVVLAILAVVNLQNGFRSLAGICFLASGYLLIQLLSRSRSFRRARLSFPRLIFVCAFGLGGFAMCLQIYSLSVQAGWLGQDAQRKYEQETGGAWGLIIGGRSEVLVSTQAILDSPIIGHGSWAKDFSYTDLLTERLARYGYTFAPGQVDTEPGLIPTHSYLLGAWVEAGILGALFWLAVLVGVALVLMNLYASRLPISPLIAFVAFSLAWDVLFSPFGAMGRLIAPYYLVLIFFAWQQLRDAPDIRAIQESSSS